MVPEGEPWSGRSEPWDWLAGLAATALNVALVARLLDRPKDPDALITLGTIFLVITWVLISAGLRARYVAAVAVIAYSVAWHFANTQRSGTPGAASWAAYALGIFMSGTLPFLWLVHLAGRVSWRRLSRVLLASTIPVLPGFFASVAALASGAALAVALGIIAGFCLGVVVLFVGLVRALQTTRA
jgi:hypothetical protein